jgi:2-amino-4-hydroxy-6-hydroxymethyldihydropteridine diphosphokinase
MQSSESGNETRIFLSLGSNLGDRRRYLESALELLAGPDLALAACSSIYETEPVELREQGDFLNLVCEGCTTLTPLDVLERCLKIEQALGRRRQYPKGPRPIDLDILLHGDQVLETPELQLPHPGLRARRFVLVPLVEIAPLVVDPVTGLTAAQLLERCPDRSRVVPLGPISYRMSSILRASANRSPRSR